MIARKFIAVMAALAMLSVACPPRALADSPAPDVQVGDKLVVATKEAEVKSGADILATVPKGRLLLVKEPRSNKPALTFHGNEWWVRVAILDPSGTTETGTEGWVNAERILAVPSLPSPRQGDAVPEQYFTLADRLGDHYRNSRKAIDEEPRHRMYVPRGRALLAGLVLRSQARW